MTPFLNVDTSLTGRRWIGPDAAQDRLAEAMAQQTRLPLPLCRILAARGVTPEDAAAFLAPSLRDLLPDPLTLKDMAPAADRLLRAVDRRERIAIFADYDVDGGSSAALLLVWLRIFRVAGHPLHPRPDRRRLRPERPRDGGRLPPPMT